MTDDRLKSYAARIDSLEEERKALSGDIRDVMTEVKSAGYNPKALRKVLAERRAGTDEAFEAELDAYRAALGVASYRAVAEKFGIPKSTLHRRVPRVENGTPDHDADGVIHETTPGPGVRPSFPVAEEQAPAQQGRAAGSSSASIGPRLASGPSRAGADNGASPEPAEVMPSVNADPLAGRVSPDGKYGQGSEVGTYSTSGRTA